MIALAATSLAIAIAAAAAAPVDAAPAASVPAAAPDTHVLRIGNRMYPDWKEEVQVAMDEEFFLGDTEFTARVTRYLPDFRILETGPGSVSDEPNNPAVLVVVYQDAVPADSSWAFKNFPPHFSPESFFTFQLIGPPDETGPQAAAPGEK